MRATRIRNLALLDGQPMTAHDPLNDPVYGDVVEGADGERRFVEIRSRSRSRDVRYRAAGADCTEAMDPSRHSCTLSAWRRWARQGRVLCTTPARTHFDSTSHRPVFSHGLSG